MKQHQATARFRASGATHVSVQLLAAMVVAKKFNFPKICDSWLRNTQKYSEHPRKI